MNTDRDNATPETPLTWTRKKEWGSAGMTHRATIEIAGHGHHYVVDSPTKGHWVARGWKDGDMDLYREATTMKDAKALAETHAKQAARAAADAAEAQQEADEAAADFRALTAVDRTPVVQEDALRAVLVDEAAGLLAEHKTDACETCKGSGADPDDPGDYDGTVHMHNPLTAGPCPDCDGTGHRVPQVVREAQVSTYRAAASVGKQFTHMAEHLADYMPRAVDRAAAAMRNFHWHMRRKCTCPTPSHRMSCGEGGKVRVVQGGAA